MKQLIESVKGFIIFVYMLLFGDPMVTSARTDNTLELNTSMEKDSFKLKIVCTQVKHLVKYTKYFKLNLNCYTYTVDMDGYINDVIVFNSTGTYPQLCSPLLNKTKYPHICAINAHLNSVSL